MEKIEAILSAVTDNANDLGTNSQNSTECTCQLQSKKNSTKNAACQTMSTGDVVITRIFFDEKEKEREKLLNSPKKQQV